LIIQIERAADFSGHFDPLLNTPAGDEIGIKSIENVRQGQGDQDTVAIVFRSEDAGSSQAQLAERNSHGTTSKLRQNFIQGNGYNSIPNLLLHDSRL